MNLKIKQDLTPVAISMNQEADAKKSNINAALSGFRTLYAYS
jgi:hypothetical protein